MALGFYSRDATVESIAAFYEFFATLPSMPKSAIEYPPPEGWPQIDCEKFAAMGKTEDVIDLLRHLPYLAWDGQIAYKTNVINYNASAEMDWYLKDQGANVKHLDPVGAGLIPDHVVVLTSGGRYGSSLLLDTQDGTVTDYVQMERPERSDVEQGDPSYWRAYQTLPIPEFFDLWKQKYRRLEWVTVPDNEDDGAMLAQIPEVDEVRDIYRAYGWPDAFKREECGEALKEWDRKRIDKLMGSAS